MKVDYAFICDYAEAAGGSGKVSALGIGFDTIYAPQLPAIHRHFSLVVQIRATLVETGQKNVQLDMIDEDGKNVIPTLRAPIILPKVEGRLETVGRLVMEFGLVKFERYGSYSLRIIIDGEEKAAVPFQVSEPPKTA